MKTYLNYIVKTKIAINFQLNGIFKQLSGKRETQYGIGTISQHISSKITQKKQASLNNKYSTTKSFVCFHFPICIKHKPDMETALSIVKHFKTELQQLNI